MENIKVLDLLAEEGSLSLEESRDRSIALSDLWDLLRIKDAQIFQRSRSRWLKEGDANTSYFHSCVKTRSRRNAILALRVGDRWVESVNDIRAEIVGYFSRHFTEEVSS
ncbi:RNA-directed DNA polymerase (Reverse transcriptase), partial [Trifolium medium]|nr:RNA-directed DNA polymerase (Reverse transcriptase) [Trifolium medium]